MGFFNICRNCAAYNAKPQAYCALNEFYAKRKRYRSPESTACGAFTPKKDIVNG